MMSDECFLSWAIWSPQGKMWIGISLLYQHDWIIVNGYMDFDWWIVTKLQANFIPAFLRIKSKKCKYDYNLIRIYLAVLASNLLVSNPPL